METSRNSCYKKSIICIGVRCALFCYLALFLHCKAISQEFNPIEDALEYRLYFFRVDPNVFIPNADTLLKVNYGDTLVFSWHQGKSEDTVGAPLPFFYSHIDTNLIPIPNDSSLYKYWYTGNDTSVWTKIDSIDLKSGFYETAVTCVDSALNESQYSEPFRFNVIGIPSQPYEVWIIVKKKR